MQKRIDGYLKKKKMKKIIQFSVVLLLVTLFACESKLVFTEPQPPETETMERFEEAYWGNYFCDSDSAIITVEPTMIHQWKYLNFRISNQQIAEDENILFIGENLYIDGYDGCFIYRIQNDTVYASLPIRDTLFRLDDPNIRLKSYNGHQVLNFKLKNKKWEAIILSLDKDGALGVQLATLPKEVEALAKITPVTNISTEDKEQYIISPTLLEFDEIIDQELVFETCHYYPKVNVDELFDLLGIVKRTIQ